MLMRRKPDRRQKATVRSVPAPVAGWNARDSIDDMRDDEAVSLINFFPGQGKVSLRSGHASHATGLGGVVETLGEFNAGASRKMFAAANGNIWDATSAGAASSLASGFTNNRWQWAQFDDASGGARVGLVNGADAPQIHTGAAVSAMTVSGSGLTVADLDGINIFKGRSYFWDSSTQDFWYSAVNALGGVLTKFPLGRVAGTGGNLIAMGTWTRDGGSGPDDLAVFLLSSGDVVIYAGSDPSSSTAWSLVGVFKIGGPMGARALTKIGSDLIVTTVDGYVPLSKVLSNERVRQQDAISDNIRNAVLYATRNYASNFGWQSIYYPLGNMGIFNVPLTANTFEQHVVNTLTGAWCKFSGLNARTWAMFNDRLYFGGSGVVYKADTGTSDNTASILAVGQTAWTYLKARSTQKRFAALRHLLQVDGSLTYNAGVGVDFGVLSLAQTESSPVASATPWGSAWGSAWSDEIAINQNWLSAEGIGYNVSSKLSIQTSTRSVDWFSTQYQFEPGRGAF